ncbi:hypothetical protein [Bifidobacterium sp. ESL0790]|uniref:hypothetical protein n=1 Tax=Bifidobacterium sp. ESL0790 TaxID=2983233 RepID=UPI0023F6B14C|nr:hypothetical protein [Bifidobacterium sp. ESL0790]WEV71989.1 hypothetical protein OZY47_05945 [Bifidobacterium sp. ESL0790]
MVIMRIICTLSWVQNAFEDYLDKCHICGTAGLADASDSSDSWTLAHDNGLAPALDIKDSEGIWVTPDLLIALNEWRKAKGMEPLLFETPAAGWMSSLPFELLGRTTLTTSVADILSWTRMPAELGEEPWSQLDQGRVPEFRAARRDLATLQHDLASAPLDSLVTVNGHIPGIAEEWCVIVHDGDAVASCGYCVHLTPDSHEIATVFDRATFHGEYQQLAEQAASEAARIGGLGDASIIVGFRAQKGRNKEEAQVQIQTRTRSQPDTFIIEADPVWCTTPYPFETDRETRVFLNAIRDSRILRQSDGTFRSADGRAIPEANVYSPDPWMLQRNRRRYLGFN